MVVLTLTLVPLLRIAAAIFQPMLILSAPTSTIIAQTSMLPIKVLSSLLFSSSWSEPRSGLI